MSDIGNSSVEAVREPPTVEESLGLLGEMLAVWRDDPPTALPQLEESAQRGVGVLAHVDHAAALTDSVILLAKAGQYVQMVPLVRMTLECAVTAAWFVVTPGSGDASLLEASRLRRAYISDLAATMGADAAVQIADLQALIDDLGDESQEAKKFEARCRSLAGGGWLYIAYRQLSELSHGGTLLLDHYLQSSEMTEANPLGFEYVPGDNADQARSILGTQGWLLHLALTAWDMAVPLDDRTEHLAEIAKRAGFKSEVRRKL
jgi:hypothetical protein